MNIKNGESIIKSLILAYETSRHENKNFYLGDEIMAQKALGVFVGYIQDILVECPNVEYFKCSTWWKHEDCDKLMNMLFDLTGDIKYKAEFGHISSNPWD
jgi:hypothetical protein